MRAVLNRRSWACFALSRLAVKSPLIYGYGKPDAAYITICAIAHHLRKQIESYWPTVENPTQTSAVALNPPKQKCLGQASKHLQKVKAMPPALSIQHTEDIAFTEDFTSIIPVSLTELTRPYCRCGNRVGSPKEKPAQGCAGFALGRLEAPCGEYVGGVRRVVVVPVTVATDIVKGLRAARNHGASPVINAR